ncbi:MAG: 16S rRNA (cytosine(967)-C(5))-methyltransferase RsmB [Verrucomicrobiota bacterium]|nr:16S rRNA (cytosine(967)-C(5))-methyltransferase RsmB [Verrucomicrobiota bacterium]
MRSQTPREIAVQLLLKRNRSGQFIETLLDSELSRISVNPRDRGLITELVYGVTRMQSLLDWLIARKTNGRTQKDTLRVLLHLGLYQMFWLDRIPNHASVNDTVELARQLGFGPQSGFINALLRQYGREEIATRALLSELRQKDPPLGFSHPNWLYRKWSTQWGNEATAQLMEWNNQPAPVYARVNSLAGPAGDLLRLWETEGVSAEPFHQSWFNESPLFQLSAPKSIGSLDSFRSGKFYIQDPSTLLAPTLLAPLPGETILDMCAAPGGKTTCLAALMKNQGRIIAYDPDLQRLNLLKENCQRMLVTCVEAVHQPPQPLAQFDRVLVDAPCSNTGVMRRRVDLRWRITPEEIERLQHTQQKLLADAARLIKPGGSLVYSTCSLEPEENINLVHQFLENSKNFELTSQRQLLPPTGQVDGAFAALLVRRA